MDLESVITEEILDWNELLAVMDKRQTEGFELVTICNGNVTVWRRAIRTFEYTIFPYKSEPGSMARVFENAYKTNPLLVAAGCFTLEPNQHIIFKRYGDPT